MKRKFVKILGVAVTVALVTALMAFAVPTSAATDEFAPVNAPNSSAMIGGLVLADCDVIDIEVTNDGTMFAAIKVESDYIMGSGGITFAAVYTVDDILLDTTNPYGVVKSPAGVNGLYWLATDFTPTDEVIVDIAVSPNYDTDSTLWVATDRSTYRTTTGGLTFSGAMGWGSLELAAYETITSIDIAPDYEVTGLNVVVGTTARGAMLETRGDSTATWVTDPAPQVGTYSAKLVDGTTTVDGQVVTWSEAAVKVPYNAALSTLTASFGADTYKYWIKPAQETGALCAVIGVDTTGDGAADVVLHSTAIKSVGSTAWAKYDPAEPDLWAARQISDDKWCKSGSFTELTAGTADYKTLGTWANGVAQDDTVVYVGAATVGSNTGTFYVDDIIINSIPYPLEGSARVLLYRNMAWTALGTSATNGFTAEPDAAFAFFSPNYESDGEVIAVTTDGTNTYVLASFQEEEWGALVSTATIGGYVAADACIAFPELYDAQAAFAFIGLTVGGGLNTVNVSPPTAGDVFFYVGKTVPGASCAIDCNVGGSLYPQLDINSIAASGSMAAPIVYAGTTAAPYVAKTTNITATIASWSLATKAPTGLSNTVVRLANDFADSNVVYAATQGDDSSFSVSDDGGAIFNGVSLIDTEITALSDVAAASKDTLFLITDDGINTEAGVESLWKSVNAGATWERIFANAYMAEVKVSPSFASDNTLYVAESTKRLWRSSNGGDTFVAVTPKAIVQAWTVVDGTTVFTCAADRNIWKTTNSGLRWTYATTKPAAIANDIVISPNYDTDSTVLLGTTGGYVYMSTDGGAVFSRVGVAGPGTDAMYVAFDTNYATNSTIYAGSVKTGEGIFRWVVGTSTEWDQIDDLDTLEVVGLLLNPAGILYAASSTSSEGMQRCVIPTAALAKLEADAYKNNKVTKGLLSSATLIDLEAVEGSTHLFAIDSHNKALVTYVDTLSTAPTGLSAVPKTTTVSLSWGSLSGALTYLSVLALDPLFTSGVIYPLGLTTTEGVPLGTAGTSIVATGLTTGTKYYWMVIAYTPVLSPPAFGSFTTGLGAAVVAPLPLQPGSWSGTTTGVALKPLFNWSAIESAAGYRMQLATDASFTTTILDKVLGAVTSYQGEDELAYSSTYFWRVKAVGVDTATEWSQGVGFTTMAKPVAPPTAAPPVIIQETPDIVVETPALPAPIYTTPGWIYAVIAVGAVLVVVVIVLIVRTRRAI